MFFACFCCCFVVWFLLLLFVFNVMKSLKYLCTAWIYWLRMHCTWRLLLPPSNEHVTLDVLNFLNHCVWAVLLLFLCCSLHFLWLYNCISLSGVFFLLFSSVKLCADCYGLAVAYCLHFISLSLSLYLNITYLKWRGFSFFSSMKGKKSLTKILCLPVSCVMYNSKCYLVFWTGERS